MSKKSNGNNFISDDTFLEIVDRVLDQEDVAKHAIENYFDEDEPQECRKYVWTAGCTF